MSEKIEVRVSRRFQASPERVYDAWLQPDKVRVWMKTALQKMGLAGDLGQVEIDPRVGGAFLFADRRGGAEARHWGTYLELERPDRIAFTWIVQLDESEEPDSSKVVMTIEPDGEGCIVTITHEMDAKWAGYVAQTENGWSCMMQATDLLLQDQVL